MSWAAWIPVIAKGAEAYFSKDSGSGAGGGGGDTRSEALAKTSERYGLLEPTNKIGYGIPGTTAPKANASGVGGFTGGSPGGGKGAVKDVGPQSALTQYYVRLMESMYDAG